MTMRKPVERQLKRSTKDLVTVVWPRIKDEIGGGRLEVVESVADKSFADDLDQRAEVDIFQVLPNGMRGLASRIQWGKPYNTFSVRSWRSTGGETELEKRLRAINHKDKGWVYPHITIQAYLSKGNPVKFLSGAAIQTEFLIRKAFEVFNSGESKYPDFGLNQAKDSDGSIQKFVFLGFDWLEKQGAPLRIFHGERMELAA